MLQSKELNEFELLRKKLEEKKREQLQISFRLEEKQKELNLLVSQCKEKYKIEIEQLEEAIFLFEQELNAIKENIQDSLNKV